MAPPRCAFGASPLGGRRQRTDQAGSAAPAGRRSPLLGFALALSAFVCLAPAWAGEGRTPKPVIEPAAAGTQCVEPADYMRRHHMELLRHQRDDTVRGGIRGAKYSLKTCISCHAGAKSQSVTAEPTNFCVSCHSYTAVKIDCFGCHNPKAQAVAEKGKP